MENEVDSVEATKTVVNCSPTIDINSATPLYQYLKQAIENNHAVEIDAGEVTKVDTAVMQVFFAFWLEAKTLELPVSWVNVSNAFRNTAEVLGLAEEMNLPNPG